MAETDLHISDRLRKLLPPLTTEERKQLKENITADGKVRDALLFWNDGQRNVVCDGMHRWEIVRGTDIPYKTHELIFDDYEAAEIWILNHQLGRRNLLKPSDIRKVIGELYNRLKSKRGGDHTSQEAKCQNDTLLVDNAQKLAETAGISPAKVKRIGARVEVEATLTKAAQHIAEKATEAEVKALAKLDSGAQNQVAHSIRTGQAKTVKEAMAGHKPPASSTPSYGKCPNCLGLKWTEDDDGVSCAKCHHPHGEPAGDVDEDRLKIQRSKTVKTAEALMRAFDDLQAMEARVEHQAAVDGCKALMRLAKGWK